MQVLDGSEISLLENDAFSELSSLRRLSLPSGRGLSYLPVSVLEGPSRLSYLDMSFVNLFPDRLDDDAFFQYLIGTRAAPLAFVRTLNLTGSLANTDYPMDVMTFSSMASLQELILSRNSIVSWQERKFANATRLRTVRMTRNWDYINLTDAMIEDFAGLRLLDLSGDDFICNDGVVHFLNMTEEREGTLEVVGWSDGYGYYCKDMDTGLSKSFREFTEGGTPLNEGYSNIPVEDPSQGDQIDVMVVVLPLLATIAVVPFVAILANVVYNNRWYLEYRWAKYKIKRKRAKAGTTADRERDDATFAYDAFVSYNREDSQFVQQCLLSRLERGDHGPGNSSNKSRRKLRFCIHERDFQPGRTIIENIVSSLEQSRACVVVMSRAYARSEWCKFEALMALQLFQAMIYPSTTYYNYLLLIYKYFSGR